MQSVRRIHQPASTALPGMRLVGFTLWCINTHVIVFEPNSDRTAAHGLRHRRRVRLAPSFRIRLSSLSALPAPTTRKRIRPLRHHACSVLRAHHVRPAPRILSRVQLVPSPLSPALPAPHSAPLAASRLLMHSMCTWQLSVADQCFFLHQLRQLGSTGSITPCLA